MTSRPPFLDQRLGHGCVYCGGPEETHDHVPSKAFLDNPLPPNLPVVHSCSPCNQSFSLDEEYLACLLECVVVGVVDPDRVTREKVGRMLRSKPPLNATIKAAQRSTPDGSIEWIPDQTRVQNVILKLARGHAAFESGEPRLEDPTDVAIWPLVAMSEDARTDFERAGAGEFRPWPEIGSRAFVRALPDLSGRFGSPWVEVQPGRYRYSVDIHGGVTVRVVIRDYLACQVVWD